MKVHTDIIFINRRFIIIIIQNKNIEIDDPNIMNFVLLGKTGDGKSTFGNRLCGDTSKDGDQGPFEASNDTQSGNITHIQSPSLRCLFLILFFFFLFVFSDKGDQ